MQGETIFRFYNTRPAIPVHVAGEKLITIDPFRFPGKPTNLLKEFELSRENPDKLKASCETIIKKNVSIQSMMFTPDQSASTLIAWFNQNRFKNAQEQINSADFRKITGGEISGSKLPPGIELVYMTIADLIAAFAFTGISSPEIKQELSIVLKLLYIRYNVQSIAETETLGHLVSGYIISIPEIFSNHLIPTKSNSIQVKPKPLPPLDIDIEDLEEVYCKVSSAWYNLEHTTEIINQHAKFSTDKTVTTEVTHLPKDILQSFSPAIKNLLNKLNLNLEVISAVEAMEKIDQEIHKTLSANNNAGMINTFIHLEGNLVNKNKFIRSLQAEENIATLPDSINNGNITATIGDLLLVKQQLKGYRLGEIAHIENVLSGEKRERNHRRLNRNSTDFFTEEEKEETRERDLQTTDRNELQTEMNRTATTELGIDLGVQVSGSYGPALSFESQLDSSFSTTVEESQRKASTFSKELSEKSSEKIRQRVKIERRKTSLEEIEEVNLHGFENKEENNITGVYRWLDKVYEAQVFNYGQRLMLDFILPEPASFYVFSMLENEEFHLEKPEPPKYRKFPLSPANIKRCNYMRYIRAYGVTGAPEPPPQIITLSYFDKQEGKDKSDFARSGKIQVPDHYAAYAASIASYIVHANDNKKESCHIFIGDKFVDTDFNDGWDYLVFLRKREKELAFAMHYKSVHNFSAAIDVFCELTETGLAAWQNKVYEAIMEAYQLRLDEYEEKLTVFNNQRIRASANGTYGSNPTYSKNCCNDELCKLAVMLLSKNAQPDINSYEEGVPPVMNINTTNTNSKIIRFFESAFEWNNMAYILYPYFWGRKARWLEAIQLHNNENEFTAFLKAGAARMQLAVRPGFEKEVAHYLQFGHLWENTDSVVGNTFLPIVQEITENSGLAEQAQPYPAGSVPWEISIPTSLVFLQKEVPVFADTLEPGI